jgi:hypothetical protein
MEVLKTIGSRIINRVHDFFGPPGCCVCVCVGGGGGVKIAVRGVVNWRGEGEWLTGTAICRALHQALRRAIPGSTDSNTRLYRALCTKPSLWPSPLVPLYRTAGSTKKEHNQALCTKPWWHHKEPLAFNLSSSKPTAKLGKTKLYTQNLSRLELRVRVKAMVHGNRLSQPPCYGQAQRASRNDL